MPKNNKDRLTLKIVTIMKVDNTNLTILFIDFHRLLLSIKKNHLIATDFYHYSGQNTEQVTQGTSKYLSTRQKSHLSMSMETLKNCSFIHFLIINRSLHNLFDAIIVQIDLKKLSSPVYFSASNIDMLDQLKFFVTSKIRFIMAHIWHRSVHICEVDFL